MVQYIRIYGGFAVLLALIALVAATIAVVAAVIAARRGRRFSTTTVRGVAWVLASTCAAAVYVLTLFPMLARGRVVDLVPFSTFAALADPTATTLVQLTGNALLLSWIGILMPALARRPWPSWKVVLLAAGISVGIEVLQYVSNSGRASTIDDVLLNTLGAYAGAKIGLKTVTPRLRRLQDGQPGRHGAYQRSQA
ncbi:VanZ family protein [Cellulomonas hominis]|uniref:VanZ family protein n=1 Tax=Cellulomonas hominis TaxID=156981 RepID=UPI001B92739D|nr:VanZ family protein [Cellulomonas hominis]VTR77172.1 hypothetical protein CHMI_01942 [Cellulomonas hominis]